MSFRGLGIGVVQQPSKLSRRVRVPQPAPNLKGKPMKRIVEIRPGEGGTDAKLFCDDLIGAYERLCERRA